MPPAISFTVLYHAKSLGLPKQTPNDPVLKGHHCTELGAWSRGTDPISPAGTTVAPDLIA